MRAGFDRVPTTPALVDNGGRKQELFNTRPSFYYSQKVTMPYQMWLPENRRSQSSWLRIVCGNTGARRPRRGRASSRTLCYYVATVVLLQNFLMAYNVARRTGLRDYENSTTNWSTNQSHAVNSHASRQAVPAQPTGSRSSNSQVSYFDELVFEATPKTERMYYRKRIAKVNPYVHHMLLLPTHLCDDNTVMVILVHSGTNNVGQRSAIRETWGETVLTGNWPSDQRNGSCAGLKLAFVLGLHRDETVNSAVRQEHAHYNDIIQGDFTDHYHNMTLKSLLDLKVVDERCPGVRYLLKTDDDMIINLPYLLLLLTNKNLQRSIMGPVNVGARVHRSGKWKLTTDEFPFSYFPPYESGSAYVITGDLIHELFVTAEYVPPLFVDDVYVTGILGRIIGVNHIMHRGFAFWHGKPPSVCDIVLNRIVSGTKMSPTLLRAVWKQLYNKPECPVSHTVISVQ